MIHSSFEIYLASAKVWTNERGSLYWPAHFRWRRKGWYISRTSASWSWESSERTMRRNLSRSCSRWERGLSKTKNFIIVSIPKQVSNNWCCSETDFSPLDNILYCINVEEKNSWNKRHWQRHTPHINSDHKVLSLCHLLLWWNCLFYLFSSVPWAVFWWLKINFINFYLCRL